MEVIGDMLPIEKKKLKSKIILIVGQDTSRMPNETPDRILG
jgi:hypothetical protein